MTSDGWIDMTCIGDQVQVEYNSRIDRYRWRELPLGRPRRRRGHFDSYHDERPWQGTHTLPDKLRPTWMK